MKRAKIRIVNRRYHPGLVRYLRMTLGEFPRRWEIYIELRRLLGGPTELWRHMKAMKWLLLLEKKGWLIPTENPCIMIIGCPISYSPRKEKFLTEKDFQEVSDE